MGEQLSDSNLESKQSVPKLCSTRTPPYNPPNTWQTTGSLEPPRPFCTKAKGFFSSLGWGSVRWNSAPPSLVQVQQ